MTSKCWNNGWKARQHLDRPGEKHRAAGSRGLSTGYGLRRS